jgi:replicative DNA helicase
MEQVRSVPFNHEAEAYVLGSILIDNNLMNTVIGKLDARDFYDENHKIIYQAMVILFKENARIEFATLIDAIRRTGKNLSVDPRDYIFNLIDLVPSTVPLPAYLEIVSEKAVERELLGQMREISDDILLGRMGFNQILDKTEDRIQGLIKKRKTSKFLTIEKAAHQVFSHIERFHSDKMNVTGLSTGFKRLDKATFGLQKGELIILAARPSVGKSAFALNLAVNVAKHNKAHVAFFSLEMSIEQLMMRLFSYQSFIPMSKIRRGDLTEREMILLGHAREDLKSHNIYFDESNASDIYEIRAKCRDLKLQDKLDLVIIDYLQLITSSDREQNRQAEVAKISRNLKILAKELEVPIIALSQLSRMVETREEKRPVLSDLRESGSIEQDADIVMFLYRPDDAKKRRRGKDKEEVQYDVVEAAKIEEETQEVSIDLLIAKNRQGSLTDINYKFIPSESRFIEEKFTTVKVKKSTQTVTEEE